MAHVLATRNGRLRNDRETATGLLNSAGHLRRETCIRLNGTHSMLHLRTFPSWTLSPSDVDAPAAQPDSHPVRPETRGSP